MVTVRTVTTVPLTLHDDPRRRSKTSMKSVSVPSTSSSPAMMKSRTMISVSPARRTKVPLDDFPAPTHTSAAPAVLRP